MVINHWVVINKQAIARDNVLLQHTNDLLPETLYHGLGYNYPKFFKMDKLCKWAWLGAEYLFGGMENLYKEFDKHKIAVILSTSEGCLDVDKRYYNAIAMPSPALFVYTLPNIMLGEISIRHGFKGEQLCMVTSQPDFPELYFNAANCFDNKGMDACLCGWVNASEDHFDVCLFWITRHGIGTACSPAVMDGLYNRNYTVNLANG